LAKGGFGALFRLGIRFEGDARPIWLYRKSVQRFWPQGEWQRLSFQLRRRPSSRGFQANKNNIKIGPENSGKINFQWISIQLIIIPNKKYIN